MTSPSAARVRLPPLGWVAGAVALGTVIDRFWAGSWCTWPMWAAIAGGWGVFWLASWIMRRAHLAAWLLLGAIAATAGLYHHVRWSVYPEGDVGQFVGEQGGPIALEAVLQSRPRFRPAPALDPLSVVQPHPLSRVELQVTRVRQGELWQPASGNALLAVAQRLEGLEAGDPVRVFAQVLPSPGPVNPGQRDWRPIRRAQRRRVVLWADSGQAVVPLEEPRSLGGLWPGQRAQDEIRGWCLKQLQQRIDPQFLGVAHALVLGGYDLLEDRQRETFLATGTMHLLAISGLHVGMVVAGLLLAVRLGWVPRSGGLVALAGTVLFYCWLTQGRAPVMRATLLVVAACGAELLSRRSNSLNSLCLAGCVVWAWNPADLFGLGPQLSFLAVATLIVYGRWAAQWQSPPSDPLEQLLAETRPWPVQIALGVFRWGVIILLASLSVWAVTLPLISQSFHFVSPVAVVLSPLLTLPVAGALLSGLGMLLMGLVFPPAADLLAFCCNFFLWIIAEAVQVAAQIPGSYLHVPGASTWWIVGFYLLLGGWLVAGRRIPRRWAVTLLLVWCGLGAVEGVLAFQARQRWDAPLRCTLLSVGNGEAILLELPGGQTILYDCGALGPPRKTAETVTDFLDSRGLRHLDAMIISHADIDHFNGVPEVLRRIDVGVVYASPEFLRHPAESVEVARQAISAAQVPLRSIAAGDRLLTTGPAEIQVWHPPRNFPAPRSPGRDIDNAHSVVLVVECFGRRILLTGDIEGAGLERLLARPPVKCDVLQVPHHGSPHSNPQQLSQWSQPDFAVISRGNRPGGLATIRQYQADGAQVLVTNQVGAITMEITPGDLHVRGFFQDSAQP